MTENEPQAKFQRSYNGKEFTDRLFGARGRKPSGEHEFDQLCQALGNLRATLHRYADLCNHQLPQAALGGKTSLQAMKEWFKSNPELFHRRPYDRPGCDID